MNKTIKMIFAKSQNGVIGNNGNIPWKHSEDMQYFKEQTMGGTVVMGRKTWASLPLKFRPLPGRDNIVVSRNPRCVAEGAEIADSLRKAIELADPNKTVWIIGGAQIYQQAIELVSEIHVTLIHRNHEGDAFAPVLPGWRLSTEKTIYKEEGKGRTPLLTFVTLVPGEPAIKPAPVLIEGIWRSMDSAPQTGQWIKLKGSHRNDNKVVELIGHYDSGGYTEGWEDNRGNHFFPVGWKGLNEH